MAFNQGRYDSYGRTLEQNYQVDMDDFANSDQDQRRTTLATVRAPDLREYLRGYGTVADGM
jgi:hypothetical protein